MRYWLGCAPDTASCYELHLPIGFTQQGSFNVCTMLTVGVLAGFAGATIRQPGESTTQPATGFLYKTLTVEKETYPYAVFVPPDYTPAKPWPVILFLHGAGERGVDGFLQTEVGLGHAIRRNVERFPALVVMPQCRPGQAWVGPMAEVALRCVEETSREYRCDPDRIYLTGLSLGGHGCWHIAAMRPDLFAAVVPICGFAELGPNTGVGEKLADKIKDLPIWCFHGEKDESVPVAKSRHMVELLRARGAEVYYMEFAEGTHNVWDQAYGAPELWRWVFEQKRNAPRAHSQPAGRTPERSAPIFREPEPPTKEPAPGGR